MKTLQTEYIVVVKKSSPFCKNVKTFNNLLTANDDIEIKATKLHHKKIEVDYEIYESELNDKDLRFFHLKFTCSQIDKINEFDELLKAVRTAAYKTDGQVKTLRDDISFHYANESYPLIYEIENLMRRLIFQFLLTNVGEDWEKDALPKDLKDGIKKRKGGEKDVTSILHETDFIQLADCLFKPFPTKEVDFLYKQLEQAKKISDLHLDNLKEFLPKSNWARYFSSLVDCEDTFLSKRWTELYDLIGPGAYGNYNKLRLKPWSLIEDSDKSKRAIRLTEKGKNFAQGLLKIPEEISKNTSSDEWEASPLCREILITDVNN